MEAWVDEVCRLVAGTVGWLLGHESLQEYRFMQRAFVGLLLLAPLCSTIGIQVVHFRLAFFSEAIGHSAFTGVALGFGVSLLPVLQGMSPAVSMTLFGVLVALAITFYRRGSILSSDTVIGVFSASVIAFGLCVITWLTRTGRLTGNFNFERFVTGNILGITQAETMVLAVFFLVAMGLEFFAYNRLIFLGADPAVAHTVGIPVRAYEYLFSVLLALVVMFSIQAVGVLLVTALLVIPAAAARNVARSAGSVFWWGLVISTTSALGGFLISDALDTTTGATIVLAATLWFVATSIGRRR